MRKSLGKPSPKDEPKQKRKTLVDMAQRMATGDITPEEKQKLADKRNEYANRQKQKFDALSASKRDIAPLPQDIDWDRRLACKDSLRLFCETYLKPIFYLDWSQDQLRCVKKLEQVCRDDGMFAQVMPRGGGKTAACRAAITWATAYGYRRSIIFVGSSGAKSEQTLEAVKGQWYGNPDLAQDFPEIAYPVARLENRGHLSSGQLYSGHTTHIHWTGDSIRYGCLQLSEDVAKYYLDHDPSSLRLLPNGLYMPVSSGTTISTTGIDGSIRGDAPLHPVTMEQLRPDLVLLDDIQKDQKADSPASCEKLIRLIDGAVSGLAGPGKHISALMPCTVMRDGDVADTYVDRMQRPEWQGERCKLVSSWPNGLTDFQISTETPEGQAWQKYCDLHRESMLSRSDFSLATEYYLANRKLMDNGFVCGWPERYTKEGRLLEVSAQQHAINLRIKSPDTFPSEYQGIGRRERMAEDIVLVDMEQLAKKISSSPRYSVPIECHDIVAFIDVQDEMFFYSVLAFSPSFSGVIVDYGTWPEVESRFFTKAQTQAWGLLSRRFFNEHPEQRRNAIVSGTGRPKAPLDSKIYWGLGAAVNHILGKTFIKEDGAGTELRISKLGVDARWGQATDAIKKWVRSNRTSVGVQLVPYFGQSMPPTMNQFEQYSQERGWMFEHNRCPLVKQPKWVWRPGKDGQYYMTGDADRLKDFLMARLASPNGSDGSICLFQDTPEQHEMFCRQVCDSEYPEPVEARGIRKNQWKQRANHPDNEYLDTSSGCIALAGLSGAQLQPKIGTATPSPTMRAPASQDKSRRVSDKWRRKG